MQWQTPKIWSGGDAWILGGGYSVFEQFHIPENVVNDVMNGKLPISSYSTYMESIHAKHVVGVNIAYMIGDWFDIIFFGDDSFINNNQLSLYNSPVLKVSCSDKCKDSLWVRYLSQDKAYGPGLTDNPKRVSWNLSSGGAAISLVANLNAKRIFLLGFDMNLNENKDQHWHSMYKKERTRENNPNIRGLPFHRHVLCFPAVKKDAERRGIEIYNVSPSSSIKVFPKIDLKEALSIAKQDRVVDRTISIVTPCSRPGNLIKLFESINFSCYWYIVFDLSEVDYLKIINDPDYAFLKKDWIRTYAKKGGVSGNLQRNMALSKIKNGFVYFLDDDNLMHPEFYTVTNDILKHNPNKRCIFYSQSMNTERLVGVRTVHSDMVCVNKIDQAQFLIHTDLINGKRYLEKYEADGLFIQEIFEENPSGLFYFFNNKPLTYYNKIGMR